MGAAVGGGGGANGATAKGSASGPGAIGGAIVRFDRDRRTMVTINTMSAMKKPIVPIAIPPPNNPMKPPNEICPIFAEVAAGPLTVTV